MSEREQTSKYPAVEGKASVRESLFKRILRKVFPDQRGQSRLAAPPAVGFLGTMHGSQPFVVGDVSLGGFRLVTPERWAAGTEMPITLQRTSVEPDQQEDRFTVQATVVRWTDDGVAFSIVLSEEESSAVFDNPLHVWWASKQEMQLFLERLKGTEEMKPQVADRRPASTADSSLQAAFNAQFHVSPHSAGD